MILAHLTGHVCVLCVCRDLAGPEAAAGSKALTVGGGALALSCVHQYGFERVVSELCDEHRVLFQEGVDEMVKVRERRRAEEGPPS